MTVMVRCAGSACTVGPPAIVAKQAAVIAKITAAFMVMTVALLGCSCPIEHSKIGSV